MRYSAYTFSETGEFVVAALMCFTLDKKLGEFIPHIEDRRLVTDWTRTFHLGPYHAGEMQISKAVDANTYKGVLDLDYEKIYNIIIPETHPLFNAYLFVNYNQFPELFDLMRDLMQHPDAESPIPPIRKALESVNKQINK